MTTRSLKFRPAFGLANAHAQTIWPSLFRKVRPLPVLREPWPRLDRDDGVIDMVLLPAQPDRPGVLMLHGLEGSGDSVYLRGMMTALHAAGFNVAALEFRSCGPTPPCGPQLYHSGRTDEIAFAIQKITSLWPGQPLAACGFSLGGNALLKYLGESENNTTLAAAVAISVPFDLAACAAALDGPGFFPRLYRKHFLKSLRSKAVATANAHAVPFTAQQVRQCETLRAFDDLVTAPLFGFADADEYWSRNSSAQFLPQIVRPTLLIAAADDPFIPLAAIPQETIASNPHLQLELSCQGGHAGFVAKGWWRPSYWAESLAVKFLAERLVR